ncbi:MAG: aminotransferase class I/II-fold pyridoxal phosphate-dependent enzyme [Magnetospirillum sp. WYHS-4]
MHNPRLDLLTDYPFDRLRALLGDSMPPRELAPLTLSIGEPQHTPPALIAETLAANAHLWGKYPPVDGTPEFRAAVDAWLMRRYGVSGVPSLPLSGTREGLFMAAALAVGEAKGGGRPLVLVPNPFYQVYSGAAVMWGAEPVFLPATKATGFLPELEALDGDTFRRTTALFLCSPANPQGTMADLDYLKRAIVQARRHDFLLIVDECYAEIYDRDPPSGALQACRELGEGFGKVLSFHSLSKRSSAAGLRSGFVAGDPEFIGLFRRLRSYGGATLPLPVLAASAALWNDEVHVVANRDLYRHKFDLADAILGPRVERPPGGFFLWLAVDDGERAAFRLWTEAGLRVLPGAYLARDGADGHNPGAGYIRVALVHDLATTEEALRRLVNVL